MEHFYRRCREAWGLLCLSLLFCAPVKAQLTLTTSPYQQNFNGIASGLPAGWLVRTGATATAAGAAGTYVATATAWNSTTGNFRNCASANALTATATTTEQSGATDRALALRQTSSIGDPGGAFVLQLANTSLKSGFTLSFKIQSLDASAAAARTATWTVSYGFGSAPTSFTTVTTSPATATTTFGVFSNTTVNVDFGSALDNNAENVWIRVATLTATSGSGSRPTTGIDDVSLAWTDLSNDNTPPTFTANFPQVSNIGTTSFDVVSNLNETGKSYFVIVPDGATAPTSAQVKAGQDATSAAVANNLKGTINHTSANNNFTANVTGLNMGTAYDVYVVAEDVVPNLQTAPVKLDASTTATDVLPPTFANTYPKASNVALTTFTLASKINEVGKTYFVILPAGANAPSAAQIKAGQDAASAAVGADFKGSIDMTSADTEFTANVINMASATGYDVWVVAEDAVPNLNTPVKVVVTTATPDVTAPTFTATYPKTSNVASTSFKLLSNIDEAGKSYFVVLPDNATAPTSAQVKAGTNAAGAAVAGNMMGTITHAAANTEYNAIVSGLTNSTAYDVYVVAEDSPTFNTPNLQASPTKIDVATVAPSTADILEDFTTCTTGATIGTWAQISVTGAQTWGCSTAGKTGNGARMNGFSGSAQENEDWLISPALDLSAFSAPNFSFWVKTNFQGPALTLKVSTNYTSGAPSTATWSNITVTMPAAGSNTWTEIKDLDLTAYKSANTRIAFAYTSTATTNGAAEWIVDDLKAYNKAPQIVLTKAQTLDVVTWNLEWFGDNTNGPTDEVLQRNNIKSVIQQIDADIYCLEEVTNQNGLNSFQTLVDELAPMGYTGVRVTHNSGFGDAQQARAFIYKTAIFSNVTTQVLSLAGSWADNRQPVIFKGDATVEGTTKTMYFITLHAKAGATATDFTTRQDNATTLKAYIDNNLATANVVVLGDFNDDLDNSIATPNPSPYKNFVDDVANFATPTKTELSDKGITTFIGSTEAIDHIVLSNEVAALYYGNSAKREDYTTSIANYSTTTTDHYPVSVRLQLGTVTPDATAPTFTDTYPKVSDITTTSFVLQSAINEAGKSYFVVLPNNATAPTSAQVKAGLDAAGAPVAAGFKGTFTHSAANLASSTTVTGITVLTDYEVFVVAEDVIPNLQANPTKVHVTAIPADIVPPTFTATYPKADQIKSNAFRLISNVSEPSKVFFVVLPNNADAPTSAQVKAGQDATGTAVATASFKGSIDNPTANVEANTNITGVLPNTDYDVFAVAEDLFGNIQASPTKIDVKTAQVLFASGYPKVNAITSSKFTLLSNLQEVGKTFFVVLPNNAPAPTSQQVAEAKDASGNLVAANLQGAIANSTALTEFATNVVGLDPATDYDVYMVAQNATNNLQPAPVKIDVTTNATTANEDDIARYVRVFPNPAREKVEVSLSQNPILGQAQARLLNIWGQQASTAKTSPAQDGTVYTFEVNNLPAGVYIIELSNGNRKFFRKVVVR